MDTDGNRRQGFAATGAMNAITVFDTELCAMGRANNKVAGGVQELIRQPVQIDAGMGTAIDIAIQPVVVLNNEYVLIAGTCFDGKPFGRICRHLSQCA